MGSSGYGSHGSNGSHEQQVSISSSSENGNTGRTTEETGKAKPTRTFQEICKGVHMLKNQDSQAGLPSPSPSLSLAKLEQKKTSDSEFNVVNGSLCSSCSMLNICVSNQITNFQKHRKVCSTKLFVRCAHHFASLSVAQHILKRVQYCGQRTRWRPCRSETVLRVAWRTSHAKTTLFTPISRSAALTVLLGKS